jgi:hypothetical protein
MLLLLVACHGNEVPICEGGGDPSVSVGYDEGDPVPIQVQGTGYEFTWPSEATGIDTTDDVTALYRIRFGDGPSNDYTARVTMLCEEPGPATYTAITPLPDEYQSSAAAQSLNGMPMTLIVAFTNPDGAGPQGTFAFTVDSSNIP